MSTSKPKLQAPLPRKKFSLALFEAASKAIVEGSDTIPAIEKQGISKSTFYAELSAHPELAARFKEAQIRRDQYRNAKRIEEAERELARRAIEGWEEPVFDIKGNHYGNKRRYSDACLIFMLKSLKPEVFAEKPQALIQNNVTITQKEEKEILAEWRQRLGAATATPSSTAPASPTAPRPRLLKFTSRTAHGFSPFRSTRPPPAATRPISSWMNSPSTKTPRRFGGPFTPSSPIRSEAT